MTHGLIGASLAALSGHPIALNDPVFLGTTIGAMLPDLDIVTHYRGRINYLLKHRGASHSFLALAGMSLALGSILYAIFPTTPWLTIVLWTLVGTLSHGIADLLNSYGAQLLWPFNRRKITFDMIMVSDPVVFMVFLVTFITSLINPSFAKISTILAFLLSLGYLGYREYDRRNIRRKLVEQAGINLKDSKDCIKVIPAMYRPFNWAFLMFLEDQVQFGIYKGNRAIVLQSLPKWDEKDPCIANALEGELADIFTKFTPYLYVQKNQEEQETKIKFMDLRYWNRDDFLYTGEVKMEADGKIIEQSFRPAGQRKAILLEY